jgi:hypothetical protein
MKLKMVFGALLVGAAMCSQGFGFELLNRMLGYRGHHSCCEPSCCEPAACEPACCEPAACEPACCPQDCCHQGCGHGCDLFAGLKRLFGHGCRSCCEPACCEPACAAPAHHAACCEPACCEPAHRAACCERACCPAQDCCYAKPCCKRSFSLLHTLFGHGCRKSCCAPSCCGNGYQNGAPAPAANGEPAPMPPVPMTDTSASRAYRRNLPASYRR